MTHFMYKILNAKITLLVSVIAVIFIVSYSFAATIKDLSPSAAEYKAVSFLVEQRIMDVDSNGNFKPSLLVTKLDLARYLYALINKYDLPGMQGAKSDVLEKIESRISNLEKQIPSVSPGSSTNISVLQSEVNELKKRLVAVENRVSILESKQIDASKDQQGLLSIQSDISALAKRLALVENKISTATQPKDYSKEIEQLQLKIGTLESKINSLPQPKYYDKDIEQLTKKTADMETKINQLSTATTILSEKLSKLESKSADDLKNLSNVTMNKITELQGNLDKSVRQLSEELEALKSRLGVLEEVIEKGQDFLQRLEALDALTVINAFSSLEVLSNRFDQLEAKYKKLEDKISEISLEQRYILNELVLSQSSTKKLYALEQRISQVEATNTNNINEIKTISSQMETLNNQLSSIRTIAYISLLVSIIAGILVILK
ncbi:S-layer homology domain-containing protein [Fervidobacterium islandicum]|uniref:S-layer homology domain-containing protein n=1 Tax=Fervidobacterium islandicum TaxID=2423 RepID=UPI003A760C1F